MKVFEGPEMQNLMVSLVSLDKGIEGTIVVIMVFVIQQICDNLLKQQSISVCVSWLILGSCS